MQRRLLIACAVLSLGAAIALPRAVTGQDGWVTLFDGKTMGDWDVIGDANWRAEGGAIVADRGKDPGLPGDEELVQRLPDPRRFWATRTPTAASSSARTDPKKIGAANSYKVNINDARPGPGDRTGGIIDFS